MDEPHAAVLPNNGGGIITAVPYLRTPCAYAGSSIPGSWDRSHGERELCQVPGASQGLGKKYVTCSGNRNCMERDYTVASPLPRFEVTDKKGDS